MGYKKNRKKNLRQIQGGQGQKFIKLARNTSYVDKIEVDWYVISIL